MFILGSVTWLLMFEFFYSKTVTHPPTPLFTRLNLTMSEDTVLILFQNSEKVAIINKEQQHPSL